MVVFNMFFFTFFKNWNNFCGLKFLRKNYFLNRYRKNFEENALYRIVDINNNITVENIATNGQGLFHLEYFVKFLT